MNRPLTAKPGAPESFASTCASGTGSAGTSWMGCAMGARSFILASRSNGHAEWERGLPQTLRFSCASGERGDAMRIHTHFLVAVAVVLAGCQSVATTQPGAVGIERQQ